MMRWHQVQTIAGFEFLSTVRRKAYLITTLGMPVFVLLYGLLVTFLASSAAQEDRVTVNGVVDLAGVLRMSEDAAQPAAELPPELTTALEAAGQSGAVNQGLAAFGNTVFRPYPDSDSARIALSEGEIGTYFVLPDDYLQTGQVEAFVPEGSGPSGFSGGGVPTGAFSRLVRDRLLEGRIPDEIAARVNNPITETMRWTVTGTGEPVEGDGAAELARLGVPIGFGILLLISVMMSSQFLIQSMAVEKENRVVEVLLSSANPDEILAGKLLGLGGAALLQMAVWLGMVGVAALFFAGTLAAMGVNIPWGIIIVGFLFFVVAYFFLGSLMLGTGSFGNNTKESQQLSCVGSNHCGPL
jgi:ABC-2 type transport system permease protein